MRIKEKMVRLLVPVVLLAGVQISAQPTVDASAASNKNPGIEFNVATKPHIDVVISDRASIMKSIGVANFLTGRCPVVDCAAPPPGCFYQGPPATDQNGCPINCGTLVCDPTGGN